MKSAGGERPGEMRHNMALYVGDRAAPKLSSRGRVDVSVLRPAWSSQRRLSIAHFAQWRSHPLNTRH
jgi:hypothetical protein